MANNYDNSDGVWRTIGGRRVFIRTGQLLSEAMIESGKFKNLRSDYRKAKEEETKNKNITSSEAIDELMNADTGDWNNMNQAQRDKTCEKILQDFEDKYGDKLKDEKFRKEVLDGLEDQNFHTMGKIIEQKYEYSNDPVLSNLDARMAEIQSKRDAVNKSFEENQKQLQSKLTDEERANVKEVMNNKDLQKQVAMDVAKSFGAKEVKVNGETINLDKKENWKDQIKTNNEKLEKELKEYVDKNDPFGRNVNNETIHDGYYELFRENERRNAKIKVEEPNEPYEFVEAYAGYHDKSYKLAGTKMNGKEIEEYGTKSWSGKEYTNDEFIEHLEDSNWHSERKQLLDAGLTNQEMAYIKDHTTLSQWSVGPELTGKENVDKMIKEAKEKFRGTNATMNNTLRQKAFEKYKKEHPNTKKTLQDFMK